SAEPSEEPTSEPSDEPTPTVPGEDGSDHEPTDGTTDGSGNADSTDGKQDDQTSGVAGSGSGPGTDSDTNAAASDQVTDSKDSSGWLANTGANIGWIAALGGLAIAAGMAMLIAKRRQQM
ncbi:MAG: LPXTG cell wall anchor domain-containing protein, partial [Yaniella sp.]|nr:LPXTG cell wall anchor domain-containing protein [Yaniella sp.]